MIVGISVEDGVDWAFLDTQVEEVVSKLAGWTGFGASSCGVDTEPSLWAGLNAFPGCAVSVGLIGAVEKASSGKVVSIVIGVGWALSDTSSGGIICPSHGLCGALTDTSPGGIVSISIGNRWTFIEHAASRLIVSPAVCRTLTSTNSGVQNGE